MKELPLSSEQERIYLEAAESLRCPTCQGLGLLESDGPFALQLKTFLKKKAAAGLSKDGIVQEIVQNYGVWILRDPPKEGVHLTLWIAPLAIFCFIVMWWFFWMRSKV